MRKLSLALVTAFGMTAVAPAAHALPVSITYALTGVVSVQSLALPVGPAGTGYLALQYSATPGNAGLASIPLPPGASVGLASGSVHLQGFSFMQVVNLAVGGAAFTGFANVFGGASAPGALAGGNLSVGPAPATIMGQFHCTGAPCPGFGFPISIPQPLSGPLAPMIAAVVGLPPGIALAFALNPFVVGSFAGFPLTAMLTATEVSRHVIPEPTTAPMLAIGLVALAAWRARRGRKA